MRRDSAPNLASIRKAIGASRSSGLLRLSGLGLHEVPSEAFDLKADIGDAAGCWWEEVELKKVVLSDNVLTTLPASVADVGTLEVLDVSQNRLEALPGNLGQLTQLKLLDLSSNCLPHLPDSLPAMGELAKLACASNRLRSLPDALGHEGQQPKLQEIEAGNNELSQLPSGLASAAALRKLHVAGNRLTALPVVLLVGLRNLVSLDVSRNLLSGPLPTEIGLLHQLQVLNVKSNALTRLPMELAGCTALVELHAGFNKLTAIPDELGLLDANLRVLDLRNNFLKTFPCEACNLRLSLLDLTNNDISKLPPALGQMTSLRSLPLHGNPLHSVRSELLTGPVSALLEMLRNRQPSAAGLEAGADVAPPEALASLATGLPASARLLPAAGGHALQLQASGLGSVPPEVWRCAHSLVRLDASNNMLTVVPAEALARCVLLQSLNLASNKLSEWPLPSTRSSLPALTDLDLSRNPLPCVPSGAFAACSTSLVSLNLSGVAGCKTMPPDIFEQLPNLSRLCMAGCGMRGLPPSILDLPRLSSLDVSTNQVDLIPSSFTRLSTLTELSFQNNNLVGLPAELGLMTQLKAFRLEGNMIRMIRRPVLESTPALLEYLRNKLPIDCCASDSAPEPLNALHAPLRKPKRSPEQPVLGII